MMLIIDLTTFSTAQVM